MHFTINPLRPQTQRESRLAKLLALIPKPLYHHLVRRHRLATKPNGPLPDEPRHASKVTDAEWETVLQKPLLSCKDKKELHVNDNSPTFCPRHGLTLIRGRCKDCTCR